MFDTICLLLFRQLLPVNFWDWLPHLPGHRQSDRRTLSYRPYLPPTGQAVCAGRVVRGNGRAHLDRLPHLRALSGSFDLVATLISVVFGFTFRVTAVWQGWEEPMPKLPPDLMEGLPER
jgi:hypothetical protein